MAIKLSQHPIIKPCHQLYIVHRQRQSQRSQVYPLSQLALIVNILQAYHELWQPLRLKAWCHPPRGEQ